MFALGITAIYYHTDHKAHRESQFSLLCGLCVKTQTQQSVATLK